MDCISTKVGSPARTLMVSMPASFVTRTYPTRASALWLRSVDFYKANLENGILKDADLNGANLAESEPRGSGPQPDLTSGTPIYGASIKAIRLADIYGLKNPPAGFTAWALKNGAVSIESDEVWNKALPQP